jgi:hypothetical protein
MATEYIIYSDESASFGTVFSNFYGGALIRSAHVDKVRQLLAAKKASLKLNGEVKWQKVTASYLDKDRALMELFLDLIEEDIVKVRIIFTQNIFIPRKLTEEQRIAK